ncbi:MAG: hypothetical protein KDB88_09835, partial [Flavobacteriales bacterium]|nr:hypothetical protein [Flavobacteriales bacterium]
MLRPTKPKHMLTSTSLRSLLAASLLFALLPIEPVQAQESGTSAKEENPGYFHGGLNLQLSSIRRSYNGARVSVSRPGIILGLGSEFFFGDYIAERLRFGMNVGWFSLASNFGSDIISAELQLLKPGFLFSANMTDDLRIDFKYSLM